MNKRLVGAIIPFGIILSLANCSNSTSTNNRVSTPDTNSIVVKQSPSEEAILAEQIDFIQEVYNKAVFTDTPDFAFFESCVATDAKHIFESEYDGGGSAPYKLRTGVQDGSGKSEVLEIKPEGNSWFSVVYTDMGYQGETRIKLIPNTEHQVPKWLLADFEQVFSEI